MASERILKLRDLIDNYDELLKYVPIQDIQYTPDPDKNVIYRFADTVIANLDQSQPAQYPQAGPLPRDRALPAPALPDAGKAPAKSHRPAGAVFPLLL